MINNKFHIYIINMKFFEHIKNNTFKILTESKSKNLIIYPNFKGSDNADNFTGQTENLNVNDCIGNEPFKDFSYFIDNEKVKKIISDVKEKGIDTIPPIKVIKHPLMKNKYLVVDGNHRLAAFKIGNIKQIKAININYDDVSLATPDTEWQKNVEPKTIKLIDALKNKSVKSEDYFTTKDLDIPKK